VKVAHLPIDGDLARVAVAEEEGLAPSHPMPFVLSEGGDDEFERKLDPILPPFGPGNVPGSIFAV
jgi:hypothetical protein